MMVRFVLLIIAFAYFILGSEASTIKRENIRQSNNFSSKLKVVSYIAKVSGKKNCFQRKGKQVCYPIKILLFAGKISDGKKCIVKEFLKDSKLIQVIVKPID